MQMVQQACNFVDETTLGSFNVHRVELLDSSSIINYSTKHEHTENLKITLQHDPQLHSAVITNNYSSVQSIIQNDDSQILAKDSNGWTPLAYACALGHSKIVKLLMNKLSLCVSITDILTKTSVHIKNFQVTILHIAILKQQKEVVSYLLLQLPKNVINNLSLALSTMQDHIFELLLGTIDFLWLQLKG